jgi:hypothetical protein
MSTLARQLSSGETMVFDKSTRDLFIVVKGQSAKNIEEAQKLHSQGKAMKLDKSQLSAINSALSHIVLLGA